MIQTYHTALMRPPLALETMRVARSSRSASSPALRLWPRAGKSAKRGEGWQRCARSWTHRALRKSSPPRRHTASVPSE